MADITTGSSAHVYILGVLTTDATYEDGVVTCSVRTQRVKRSTGEVYSTDHTVHREMRTDRSTRWLTAGRRVWVEADLEYHTDGRPYLRARELQLLSEGQPTRRQRQPGEED